MDQSDGFYNRSLRYLAIRPRSEKEIRDYLKKKDATDKVIDFVVEKLRSQKFIDDAEFIRWWVRQRTVIKQTSYMSIKRELALKGVDRDLIESTITDLGDEKEDELAMAKKIVAKKIDKYDGFSKNEVYQKLGGVLARRGFSWSIIKRAIDDYSK